MEIVKTKRALEAVLSPSRTNGNRIVLVPTMGALHAGHLDLVRRGKALGDLVVCSIFVNPTQFNDPEDLRKYPRPLSSDIQLLEAVDCDVLFLPDVHEMYGDHESWTLDLGILDQIWEGKHRPGHFQGVTQIVYKLFVAAQADVAIFGQKDLQQFQVIQRMVELKTLPVQLVLAPTVREADGLAMSSRNVRLSARGRQQALALYDTLTAVQAQYPAVVNGEITLKALVRMGEDRLRHAEGVTLEYFAICDRRTLMPAEEADQDSDLVVLVAAWVDGVRLIDNTLLTS